MACDCAAGISDWLAQPTTTSHRRQVRRTHERRTCGNPLRMPSSDTSCGCRIGSPPPARPRPSTPAPSCRPPPPARVPCKVICVDRSDRIVTWDLTMDHYYNVFQAHAFDNSPRSLETALGCLLRGIV